MEPSDPGSAQTPDDWTPWATPEPEGNTSPQEVASADASPSSAASPASAPIRTPSVSRRRVAAAPAVVASGPTFSVGGVMVAVGAVIVAGGTFLEMVKVGLGLSTLNTVTLSKTYFDSENGKIVAAIAAAVLVLALAALLRSGTSLIPAALAALGGFAALGFAIYDRIDVDNSVDDLRTRLRGNTLRGLVHFTVGPALYVCMGGAVIVLVGAALAAKRR